MKELYIFSIRKEFAKIYSDRASELFFIFNRIYYMKEIDRAYGYNLFNQVCIFLNKKEINSFIERKYENKIMYSRADDEHVINNLFLNEVSILKVKPSNIKIETNIDNPTFLKDLKQLPYKFFVCNFKEQEFYFLKKKKETIKS